MLTIASLAIYPVKGLRGMPVDIANVEPCGLEHDRRWAILHPDGRVMTQRDFPSMACIDARPSAPGLRLEADGHGGVAASASGPPLQLTIWGAHVPATAANPEASHWLTHVLGAPCTLAYLANPTARRVTTSLARPGDVVSLADGFPLLVTTVASLAALNAHLPDLTPMERFRPNLVLDGGSAWAEDTWSHVQAGSVRLRLASPCSRCTVITIDQQTGAAMPRKEPFRTLGRLRRTDEGQITFGWNVIPETLGALRIGDQIVTTLR